MAVMSSAIEMVVEEMVGSEASTGSLLKPCAGPASDHYAQPSRD